MKPTILFVSPWAALLLSATLYANESACGPLFHYSRASHPSPAPDKRAPLNRVEPHVIRLTEKVLSSHHRSLNEEQGPPREPVSSLHGKELLHPNTPPVDEPTASKKPQDLPSNTAQQHKPDDLEQYFEEQEVQKEQMARGFTQYQRPAPYDDLAGQKKHYHREADALQAYIEKNWPSKTIHEAADGVNIKAVFDELHRRIDSSEKVYEYAIALRDALMSLGDAHLRLSETGFERTYNSALKFESVQEGVALKKFDAKRYGHTNPSIGDLLVEVNGKPVEQHLDTPHLRPGSTHVHRRAIALEHMSWQTRLWDEALPVYELTLQRPDGSRYQLKMQWEFKPKGASQKESPVTGKMLTDTVGYLNLRTFLYGDLDDHKNKQFQTKLDNAVQNITSARAVVVDLRENQGGVTPQSAYAAQALINKKLDLYGMRMSSMPGVYERDYVDVASPSGGPLSHAKLFFLIGPQSASEADFFAAAFRHHGDVVLVGSPTAGARSGAKEFPLPHSKFFVIMPVAEMFRPGSDSEVMEAKSVMPDVPVVHTAEDIRTGRDSVLDRALKLATESVPNK